MAYQQFMYEEAFEFKNDQDLFKLKQAGQPLYDETHTIQDGEKRLPPLGACSNDVVENPPAPPSEILDIKKFIDLQEQHEQMNSSLFALTSHFAQVQFRLKQIINGPKDNQEKLMEELEEFAFAGCPDVMAPNEGGACTSCVSHLAIEQYEERVAAEEDRERRLDNHLKKMITDLEICQKEADEGKKVSRKSSKHKPNNDYQRLSRQLERSTQIDMESEEEEEEALDHFDGQPDDIKKHIDKTMARLINPKQAKESIISQVNKQIHDMEKFVNFLNSYDSSTDCDTDVQQSPSHIQPPPQINKKNKSKNTSIGRMSNTSRRTADGIPAPHTNAVGMTDEKRRRVHEASVAIMKKGLALLQIFAISQFGCSAKHFKEHMMRKKETATVSSTGHLKPLSEMKLSIDHMMAVHAKLVEVGGLHPDSEDELNLPISSADKRASWSRTKSRSRTESITSQMSQSYAFKSIENSLQEELIRVVRGDFANSLKELLQHGLFESFTSKALSTKALVGCMSSHTSQGHGMHVWEYFDAFYRMKHGQEFNTQPSMMLSEAFAMDVGCTQQTPKQSLLTVLHRIKSTHESRKRSFDAMFKALMSAGLNRGRLAQWIRLVIRMPELVDRHYERWSYVVKSGFDDVLTSLEKLSSLTFFLPEDLAIRHLMKNTNEFGDA